MIGKYYLIASLAIASVACTGKTDIETAKTPVVKNFEINFVEKSLSANYLCVGDTTFGSDTKLYTTSMSTLQWPTKLGDSNIKTLQDTLQARCFGDSIKSDIDKAMIEYAAHPITMDENSKLQAVDTIPTPDGISIRILEQSVNIKVLNANSRYAVFEIYHYMYGGGAHPIYASSFVNFDIQQGKVLTFDDIILPNKKDSLIEVIKNCLRGQYGTDSDEKLQELSGINLEAIDYAMESPNFYLNDYSIVFYFNPYEIGPWAIGTVEVPVATYTTEGIIKPEITRLINQH